MGLSETPQRHDEFNSAHCFSGEIRSRDFSPAGIETAAEPNRSSFSAITRTAIAPVRLRCLRPFLILRTFLFARGFLLLPYWPLPVPAARLMS